MSDTTAELPGSPPQTPSTMEQEIKQRQTGIETWSKFEDRIKDRPEPPAKDESEGSLTTEQRKAWDAEKAPAKGEAKPEDAKAETAGDAKEAEAAKETADAESQQTQTPLDRLYERASKEPDFDKVVERLHEPFFPLSQEGYARYQTMNYAINQVSNADDVIYFLARPENSSIARNMQDAPPHKIAQVIHQISADLRFGVRERSERPKPSAPKPVSEVGGRGVAADDPEESALRSGNFRTIKQTWDRMALRK